MATTKYCGDYPVGSRVELHPATDLWMCGARYGTLTRATKKACWVKVDKLGKTVRVAPENIGRVLEDTGLGGFSGFASLPGDHVRQARNMAKSATERASEARKAIEKGDCGTAFFNIQVAHERIGEARGNHFAAEGQDNSTAVEKAASDVMRAGATFAKACVRKGK